MPQTTERSTGRTSDGEGCLGALLGSAWTRCQRWAHSSRLEHPCAVIVLAAVHQPHARACMEAATQPIGAPPLKPQVSPALRPYLSLISVCTFQRAACHRTPSNCSFLHSLVWACACFPPTIAPPFRLRASASRLNPPLLAL